MRPCALLLKGTGGAKGDCAGEKDEGVSRWRVEVPKEMPVVLEEVPEAQTPEIVLKIRFASFPNCLSESIAYSISHLDGVFKAFFTLFLNLLQKNKWNTNMFAKCFGYAIKKEIICKFFADVVLYNEYV